MKQTRFIVQFILYFIQHLYFSSAVSYQMDSAVSYILHNSQNGFAVQNSTSYFIQLIILSASSRFLFSLSLVGVPHKMLSLTISSILPSMTFFSRPMRSPSRKKFCADIFCFFLNRHCTRQTPRENYRCRRSLALDDNKCILVQSRSHAHYTSQSHSP